MVTPSSEAFQAGAVLPRMFDPDGLLRVGGQAALVAAVAAEGHKALP